MWAGTRFDVRLETRRFAFLPSEIPKETEQSHIPPALERFDVFLCAIPCGLLRRTSMVVEFRANGLEARFWTVFCSSTGLSKQTLVDSVIQDTGMSCA